MRNRDEGRRWSRKRNEIGRKERGEVEGKGEAEEGGFWEGICRVKVEE